MLYLILVKTLSNYYCSMQLEVIWVVGVEPLPWSISATTTMVGRWNGLVMVHAL